MVTIKSYGQGTCIWCSKEKEGVEVASDDKSFIGFLCIPDLRRMLRLKSSAGSGKASETVQK
jgi:hypothetical protein